jgi:hypothetical protein
MRFVSKFGPVRGALAVLGAAAFAMLALAGPAHAAPQPDPPANGAVVSDQHLKPPYIKQIHVTMTKECDVAPNTVHKGDDLRKACGQPGAVVPQNVVRGNCGDSFLFVFNLGNGVAGFETGADSSLGPILFGSASVSWINVNNLFFNTFNLLVTGNAGPASWFDFNDQFTGRGTVVADMSGDVFVGNLTICSIDFPTDVENIS